MLSEKEIKEIMDNVKNGFLDGKVLTPNEDGSCDVVEWELRLKIYRIDADGICGGCPECVNSIEEEDEN